MIVGPIDCGKTTLVKELNMSFMRARQYMDGGDEYPGIALSVLKREPPTCIVDNQMR